MISEDVLRLREFVDRDPEVDAFGKILSDDRKLILVISGGRGIGKTSLLARLMHECGQRRARSVGVARSGVEVYDYLAIMRKIREGVGEEKFSAFTDLVNYLTVPDYEPKLVVVSRGSITVAEGLQVSNAQVGDIAGVKIEIKDLNYVAPRNDQRVPEPERIHRLTKQFLSDLATALRQAPLIVFVDDVEEMVGETRKWLWSNLIKSAQNGHLSNIKFVLTVRDQPPTDEFDRLLQMIASKRELQPLDNAHVVEYLERRGVPSSDREDLAKHLMKAFKGHPQAIANFVDLWLQE